VEATNDDHHHHDHDTGTRHKNTDRDKHHHNPDSCMDDFMGLFTSTLRSLAADARCVRDISALAEVTGVVAHGYSTTSLTWRDELLHDGGNTTGPEERQRHVKELVDLDKIVASMEQKVVVLREIINEENLALSKFETSLQEEADAQDDMVQEILSIVERMQAERDAEVAEQEDNGFEVTYQQPHQSILRTRTSSTGSGLLSGARHQRKPSLESDRNSPGSKGNTGLYRHHGEDESPSKLSTGSRNSSYSTAPSVSFVPITEAEILDHSRNVPFGLRISRFDLNDALEEIQAVLSRKIAVEERVATHAQLASSTPSSINSAEHRRMSANSLQRRFDYLRQRQRGSHAGKGNKAHEIETDAHAGHWWVTEQELRENCAFFRHGESSARGILGMLCSLKRLKQVPGKHMEITYLWL
jgi:hypothetical protein